MEVLNIIQTLLIEPLLQIGFATLSWAVYVKPRKTQKKKKKKKREEKERNTDSDALKYKL